MAELKICKNCVHFQERFGEEECLRTADHHTNVVTGKKYVFFSSCRFERQGACGQSARFFKKPATVLERLKSLWG